MLSLTSRLCRQSFLSPRLQIFQSAYILNQIRTKTRIKLPPELPTDHTKRVILGPAFPFDPATNKFYLKDIEAIRFHNSVTRLGALKQGHLDEMSIHSRAELLVELMRCMDRHAVQTEYEETGSLRILPELDFYLERAYYVLRGNGDWTK